MSDKSVFKSDLSNRHYTMTSTLVKDFESKDPCPRCNEKKLFTNDTHKDAQIVRYHCLCCNHEFSEVAELKELKKRRNKTNNQDEPSGLLAAVFIAVMMVVIFAITQTDQKNQAEESLQPEGQTSGQSDFLSR
ncbi:MAG: hypothetical protein WA783_07575 [Phormidesmis sp.]